MDNDIKKGLVQTYDLYARVREESRYPEWKCTERGHFAHLVQVEGKRSLLEIGAGTGRDSRFFQDIGLRVVATDMAPEMVRLCREKELPGIRMDCYRLGFRNESFEAAWALNSLLHVPRMDLPGVLAEIRAILKPDALFYLGMWGGHPFEGIWEDDYYTPKRFFSFHADPELLETVQGRFEVVSFNGIDPEGSKGHFQSMILRKT